MAKLILMRHGESIWNKQNIFTGWVDVPLSKKGMQEAVNGGKKIKDIDIDIIFTSTLVRAQQTLFLAMAENNTKKTLVVKHEEKKLKEFENIYNNNVEIIPIYISYHLNERMYGELQGNNKDEMFGLLEKEI